MTGGAGLLILAALAVWWTLRSAERALQRRRNVRRMIRLIERWPS